MALEAPWYEYAIGRAHDATDNANGGELGVDLATPLNTPITTPFAGVVTYAGSNAATGGIVKVATNIPGVGNVFEYFLHLNAGAVKAGQTVQAGQLVGLSGGTQPGAGGWPHVEYGLFTDPKYATQYWGFQSGSTLDPTGIINQLHTSGGVGPSSTTFANPLGVGNQGNPISILIPSSLTTLQNGLGISKISDLLWMGGLILLGGLLIVAGVIVFILPNRRDMNTAATVVAGTA